MGRGARPVPGLTLVAVALAVLQPHGARADVHLQQPSVSALPAMRPPPPQVTVAGEQRAPFAVAFPPLLGQPSMSNAVLEVAVQDFNQSELLQVVDPESYTSVNLDAEGMSADARAWRAVHADVVIKGEATLRGAALHLELRAYVFSRRGVAPATAVVPSLRKEYDVAASDLRWVVHEFDNDLLRTLTGVPGSFGGHLAFTSTVGQREKAIFEVHSDGTSLSRVPTSPAAPAAIAPAFGPSGLLFYAGEPDGVWSLFRVGQDAPLSLSVRTTLGVAFSPDGAKMAVVVGREGASDIYVGAADGTGLSLVVTGGVNMHPAFGPAGQLAYVSTHEGNPQVYLDGVRVTNRGSFNMAPSFCNDPAGPVIAFMGRDGTTWDIFTVSPSGSPASVRRLTQDHGSNTYPACSPDGRTIAFFSTEGGLYTMGSHGGRLTQIAATYGESLRWAGN